MKKRGRPRKVLPAPAVEVPAVQAQETEPVAATIKREETPYLGSFSVTVDYNRNLNDRKLTVLLPAGLHPKDTALIRAWFKHIDELYLPETSEGK